MGRSEKLILFFGAGASAAGGYRTFLNFPYMFWPTTTEPAKLQASEKEYALLKKIRQELTRKKKPLTLDQYLGVLDSYKSVMRNIFSDTQLRSFFSDSRLLFSRLQDLNQIVERARTHICALTAEHYMNFPSFSYYNSLRTFINRLLKNHNEIYWFTTNYDLIPEYVLSNNISIIEKMKRFWKGQDQEFADLPEDDNLSNSLFLNGFEEFQDITFNPYENTARWDGSSYRARSDRKKIFIFRLHGCVSWIYEDDNLVYPDFNRITFNLNSPRDINRHFERLCVYYPGKERPIGLNPFSFSFNMLNDLTFEESNLNFIGYAFRDSDVVGVALHAAHNSIKRNNDNKTIKIINPDLNLNILNYRISEISRNMAFPISDVVSETHFIIENKFFPGDAKNLDSILSFIQGSDAP